MLFRSDEALNSIGRLNCYDITSSKLLNPELVWSVNGNFTNGGFGHSFAISPDSNLLAISAPAYTGDLVSQGIVYVLNLTEAFRTASPMTLTDLKSVAHYIGHTFYARLGSVVKFNKDGDLFLSEPYAEEVGAICRVTNSISSTMKCRNGTSPHSQYGYVMDVESKYLIIGAPRYSNFVENGGQVVIEML